MFKLSENSLTSKIDNVCIVLSKFPMSLKVASYGILNPMVNSTIFLTMKCDQKLYIVLRICSFYLSERTTL